MFRRTITVAMLAALVSLAVVACGGGTEPAPSPTRPSPPPPPPAPAAGAPAPAAPSQPAAPAGTTSFTVHLNDADGRGPFAFEPANLTFGVGETVNFTFIAEATFHTFTVGELGTDVSVAPASPETLSFTFDKPGTYQLICIPHQALGMVGTITVQ